MACKQAARQAAAHSHYGYSFAIQIALPSSIYMHAGPGMKRFPLVVFI
jgi:hypothetical protein